MFGFGNAYESDSGLVVAGTAKQAKKAILGSIGSYLRSHRLTGVTVDMCKPVVERYARPLFEKGEKRPDVIAAAILWHLTEDPIDVTDHFSSGQPESAEFYTRMGRTRELIYDIRDRQ